MTAKKTEVEVLIIGGGPAGLSALLWSIDLGQTAILLDNNEEFGGQLLRTFNPVNNYLGLQAAEATKLRDIFVSQVIERGGKLFSGVRIAQTHLREKEVICEDGTGYKGRAVIIATGVRRRRLGIPGEVLFAGRGVLDSGVRSRNELTGQSVLVVGGGDAAIENALILSEKAKKVTVVHRRQSFTARREFLEKAERTNNIEFLTNMHLNSIIGSDRVEAVELIDHVSDQTSRLAVDSVLIRIGTDPNSELFRGQIKLDDAGYIVTGSDTATSAEGVFAVGDVTAPVAPTISTAVGHGAVAARAAADFLS